MSDGTRPTFVDYFLLVLLAAIFGSSFMLIGVILDELPTVTLVTLRLAIAAVFFFIAMIWFGQRLPSLEKVWIFILGASLTGNVLPFFLIAWGQEKVDAGLAAIFMACMPLMTIFIAHFFTDDEKLTPYKIAGFCLGLLGVIVMMGFDNLGSLGGDIVRQYALIAAALCYAVNAIISKKLIYLPRMAMMSALMIVSTLLILPVGLITGETMAVISGSWPSNKIIWSVLALGIFPTAIGTILIFKIISVRGASFLSQINFMVPVFGVLWAMVFLSEVLPANAVIALAIILLGVAVARFNPKSKTTLNKGY